MVYLSTFREFVKKDGSREIQLRCLVGEETTYEKKWWGQKKVVKGLFEWKPIKVVYED